MSEAQLGIYNDYRISTLADLEEHYGPANPASLIKEIDHISDHYRAFIEKSPFAVLATVGPDGLDCSPRGDPPGFVRVLDKHTVAMPDRRGNNRIDNLRNLVNDPRASLLFLIPGVGETIRINGRGYIVTEPELCKSFEMQNKIPATVILFKVDRIYFQCPKALVRSKLWQTESKIERSELPTTGQIISALSQDVDGEEYDRNYPKRLKETIY
ncbi:MAG: pyridoxamine 5'-phosphate oxidase family protein [Pseudomonadota bacterium]